jgi:predicted anti-sigma-YlaC factor YlaD
MSREGAHRCDRAREWISLRLDGELSELEHRLLGRHLRRCPECSAFAARSRAATAALREAALERYHAQIHVPHRRRLPARALHLAAAASILATIGVSSVLGALSLGGDDAQPPTNFTPAGLVDDTIDMTRVRRAQLMPHSPDAWLPTRRVT